MLSWVFINPVLTLICHLILSMVIFGHRLFWAHRYYALLLDDYSKFLWTFPLSHKSQTFSIFLSFKTFIRTQFKRDIKNIQCNNGREFDNGPFGDFFKSKWSFVSSILFSTSPQNGKAEDKFVWSTILSYIIGPCFRSSFPLASCFANVDFSSQHWF